MNKALKKMTTDGRLIAGAQAGKTGAGCYKVSMEEKTRIKHVEKAAVKKLGAAEKGAVKKIHAKKSTASKSKKKVTTKSSAGKKVVVKAAAKKKVAGKKSAPKKIGAKAMRRRCRRRLPQELRPRRARPSLSR